jgi:hypothetical protein
VLSHDETPALAARARLAARAVAGLVLEEQRAARFVHDYSFTYFRQGIAGEAEHKAELLAAIERESLLLVAARIERALPGSLASHFSRLSEGEAISIFRQAFLTFLGGSLAWDNQERESFRKDLAMYLRLASRESRVMVRQPGVPTPAGAFVDRCAFLVDPSMMGQAREAAARYQAQLESCADQALRAAFRGLRARTARPARERKPTREKSPRPKPARKSRRSPRPKPKRKPRTQRKKSPRRRKAARPTRAKLRRARPSRARARKRSHRRRK